MGLRVTIKRSLIMCARDQETFRT